MEVKQIIVTALGHRSVFDSEGSLVAGKPIEDMKSTKARVTVRGTKGEAISAVFENGEHVAGSTDVERAIMEGCSDEAIEKLFSGGSLDTQEADDSSADAPPADEDEASVEAGVSEEEGADDSSESVSSFDFGDDSESVEVE